MGRLFKNALIIEHKIDTDMKEVIAKMESSNQGLKNEIKIVYWVVGIAMAIMLAVLAFKK